MNIIFINLSKLSRKYTNYRKETRNYTIYRNVSRKCAEYRNSASSKYTKHIVNYLGNIQKRSQYISQIYNLS